MGFNRPRLGSNRAHLVDKLKAQISLVLEGFVRRRIAAVAVLAVGLALGTAGCTFSTPQATLIKYNPSDGVSANVGKIQIRNAFVIAPHGKSANLIAVFINTSTTAENVHLQYESHAGGTAARKTIVIHMDGGQVISFGNPGVPQLVFEDADVPAGALIKVFVQYGSVSGQNVLMPVLNGTQSYYKGLGPSATPTPTPSDIPTPIPTSTTLP
jgi:hypothetical protein